MTVTEDVETPVARPSRAFDKTGACTTETWKVTKATSLCHFVKISPNTTAQIIGNNGMVNHLLLTRIVGSGCVKWAEPVWVVRYAWLVGSDRNF